MLLLTGVCAAKGVADQAASPITKTAVALPALAPGVVLAVANKPFKSKSGYSIQPPVGWKCDITGSTGTDLFVTAPKPANSGFVPNINVIVHAVPDGTTIKDVKTALASDLASAPTFTMTLSDVATVADDNALHVLLNFDQGTPLQHLRSEEYLILHAGYLYEVTYTSPRAEREMYAAQFSAMLHSIKWIPITLPTTTPPAALTAGPANANK